MRKIYKDFFPVWLSYYLIWRELGTLDAVHLFRSSLSFYFLDISTLSQYFLFFIGLLLTKLATLLLILISEKGVGQPTKERIEITKNRSTPASLETQSKKKEYRSVESIELLNYKTEAITTSQWPGRIDFWNGPRSLC